MGRRLMLNYVLGTQGHPWSAWRHPDSRVERVTDLDFHVEQARIAERGRFDALFLVDSLALFPDPAAPLFWTLDPVTLMAALAAATERVGLIATVGTSFASAYGLARRLASLDHLSGGRAGWNVVTSASEAEARNHGQPDAAPSDQRYRRAAELLDAVLQLWHAWDADAVVADRAAGVLVDPERVHAIEFAGEDVVVRGPLATPRSPQVVPLICQAGPSPAARAIAGRYADLVYAAYGSLEQSRAYRDDLRARARAAGRSPDAIRLMPAVIPFVKSTEAEARRLHRELIELEQDDGAGDLHEVLVGTPEQVADWIANGFEHGAFDGLSITAPLVPGSLEDFVDHVVPILQARGLHQREYAPGTLRERLGMSVDQPVDRSRWTRYYASRVSPTRR